MQFLFFISHFARTYLWFFKKNNTYRLNDAISSLFMGSLRTANKLIFIGLGGYVFYLIETNTMLWRMDVDSAFTWIFAFVVYDFLLLVSPH